MSQYESSLSSDLAERVAAELGQDEELVWAGQPRLDLAMRPAFFFVPFGFVFGGFAVFWMVMAGAMTGGFMAPCGLPFIAVGVGMICSPIWLRKRAAQTIYALTNRRAIVWEPGWFGAATIRNYTAAGLGKMSRMERRDGSGDLIFEELLTYHHNSDGGSTQRTRRGFLAIDRVREVEDLVRRTLLKDS